jgi:hypothetical protein
MSMRVDKDQRLKGSLIVCLTFLVASPTFIAVLITQDPVLNSSLRGAVAQLGERLNGIQEVVGSTPIGSTKLHSVKNPPLRGVLASEGEVLDASGSL